MTGAGSAETTTRIFRLQTSEGGSWVVHRGRRILLAAYLLPLWPRVLLLAALLFGDIGLRLLNPQILRSFIDSVQNGASSNRLAGDAVFFLVVVAGTQIVSGLATYFSEDVGWIATNRLRRDLALHCLRLDLSFHHAHTPGELIARVDGDVALLSNFFSAFVIRVVGSGLLLIGILILIAREDLGVGVALAIYAFVSLLILRRAQRLPVPSFRAFRAAYASLSSFWEELLVGMEDIRSCAAEGYMLQRQDDLLRTHARAGRKTLVLSRVFQSVLEVLTALGTALAFGLGAYLFHRGTITLGTVFMIAYYTGLLADNLGELTTQLGDLQSASAGIERIRELYYMRPAIKDGPGAALPAGPPAVTFEHVIFNYSAAAPVLQDVSFHLEAGEVLGLVGRTGSGKTTLARLLPRFYDPGSGTVRLGDVDIRQLHLGSLRGRIGMVTQDVQLFAASLRDNLTLFRPALADDRLLRALEDLGLQDWCRTLPTGLDSQIAPGQLSAGEAQLLALTRVFLQNPDLVILDEASSRLDPHTEWLLERALQRLLRGRTGIIIAHRLATLERVDQILVLADGRLREYGSRAALAADPTSHFARLLRTGLREDLA
jgi:ABC-type multidrug transport system fused ATPase/permease subunit